MITHTLKIGQRIWDTHDDRWGKILLIGGEDKDAELTAEETDTIILYEPDDGGECETWAENVYPLIEDKYFRGEEVCLEINRDVFDSDHDFDYYCPERDENCWEFEVA